jgi:hypothetical protein
MSNNLREDSNLPAWLGDALSITYAFEKTEMTAPFKRH